jgi:hypothetical protein
MLLTLHGQETRQPQIAKMLRGPLQHGRFAAAGATSQQEVLDR